MKTTTLELNERSGQKVAWLMATDVEPNLEALGLKSKLHKVNIDQFSGTMIVSFAVTAHGADGVPIHFARLAPKYGLIASDYHRSGMRINGTIYRIDGIKTRNYRYPDLSDVCSDKASVQAACRIGCASARPNEKDLSHQRRSPRDGGDR